MCYDQLQFAFPRELHGMTSSQAYYLIDVTKCVELQLVYTTRQHNKRSPAVPLAEHFDFPVQKVAKFTDIRS
jgi:hypothetical protein